MVTFGIGTACSTIGNFYVRAGVSALAHGTFQGGMTAATGGKFWAGFAAGAISSLASSFWQGGSSGTEEGFFKENDWAYGSRGVSHQGASGALGMQGSLGTIAFGTVMGGAGSALAGGNFWQGAVTGLFVSGFNHVMHNGDSYDEVKEDPKPKIKAIPKELQAKIDRLRAGFEFMEDYGGYAEMAGLVLAPFTEGASLGVAGVGMAFTAVGTTGNAILDLVEYKYTNDPAKLISARNRVIKYALTFGTGKALEKLTFNFTDKLITKFLDVVIDKGIYTPVLPTTKPR